MSGASDGRWHWSLPDAAAAELQPGRASALLFAHGSMHLRYYAPRGEDPQTPHDQDELYVIATGSGWFLREGERVPFAPGDVLFVAAGETHRFEDFSDDFGTWVVFYGPRADRDELEAQGASSSSRESALIQQVGSDLPPQMAARRDAI